MRAIAVNAPSIEPRETIRKIGKEANQADLCSPVREANRPNPRGKAMTIDTLPRFEIRPLSEEEGGGYLIEFPDYPGCIADGETPEEAMHEGRDALTAYVRTLEELGRAIPNPKSDAFSGQWRLRVPRSMHAALARRADREGVSLNSLVTAMLAEGLGRRDVRD
jgi:antitoxin HicB